VHLQLGPQHPGRSHPERSRQGRFQAFSAGSQPAGQVNPIALELLQRNRISTEGLRSKDWNEFAAPDAPHLDFVFTVCDKAAGEAVPVWPGQPMTAHWGVEDPVAAVGSPDEIQRAFSQAFMLLHRRISLFASLPLAKLEGAGTQARTRSDRPDRPHARGLRWGASNAT
jgi:arsenate reductase